jgi:diguanylate cyclase (GGDEF)-like protein
MRRSLRPDYKRIWVGLNRPILLGISGRLVISFAAVAVLAAAANLIVEHGVEVIRTIHRETSSPIDRQNDRPALSRPIGTPPPLPAPIPFDLDSIRIALQHYQGAVEVRVLNDSAAAEGQLMEAAKDLETVSRKLQESAQAGLGAAAVFARKTKEYEQAGRDDIQIADDRRSTADGYNTLANDMENRLTASLDGAWKIFGRVLARQSLLQLHAELDDMRRTFVRMESGEIDAAAGAMSAGEAKYAATFAANAKSLARSEGAAWVERMRNDFATLVERRQAMMALSANARDAARILDESQRSAAEAIPRLKKHAANAPAALPAPQSMAASVPAALSAPPPSEAAVPSVDTITTRTTAPDGRDRRTVAWITVAVLVVLLLVSVSTVRSVALPVRRMLRATERIANGDANIRLPRGGIKELDTLGGSFNHMAAQLAAAREMTRDYQQRLEERVEQRTRQLQHLAEHDPLTHLPNRRQLFVLLNHALERARQHRLRVAVFFVDIDNFKNLNDSLGHAFGDQVLSGIAERLREAAQGSGFAGRLGGDEFTVVYEDAATIEVIRTAGQELVNIFERPLVIDEREIVIRASVGASWYPEHGERGDELLSAADAALFQAKALGRSQLAEFTPALLETATRKFTIEQGLRRAIEHGEFELAYQPEIRLRSMDMVLVEALLRWRLPNGRQAPPAEFLAVTEESGLITEVGNWVLRKAIETASHWHHGQWPQARVAINVSPRQLLDRRFVDYVQGLLREFRIPASCIELELTESVLQSGPATIEALHHLRALDIPIALDDFGTGYSSLASLENLPLTRIKLDRTLISSIDTNPRSAAIAAAIIRLCSDLNLEMTAEGVERLEQFAILAEHPSIDMQGYLISKPVAESEVIAVKGLMPQLVQNMLLESSSRKLELGIRKPKPKRATA